jgi:hypothetical protein
MDIATRHIRHDWPEWVDWDNQKTVKTMCGVRSRPGLCGIPGITKQSAVVERNGRKVWGWCMNCVTSTFPYYRPPALTADVTSAAIIGLHDEAREQLSRQMAFHYIGMGKRFHRQGDFEGEKLAFQEARVLDKEFGLGLGL